MGENSKLERELINKGLSGETMGTSDIISREFTQKKRKTKGEMWGLLSFRERKMENKY